MERLQIHEIPSIAVQHRQAPISQGPDEYWLPSSVNWRRYARNIVAASTLFLILFVMINVHWTPPDQSSAPDQDRIVQLAAALRDRPNDLALYWMLGDAYFDQENYGQALANYHRYLDLAPDHPPQRLLQRLDYLEFHARTR